MTAPAGDGASQAARAGEGMDGWMLALTKAEYAEVMYRQQRMAIDREHIAKTKRRAQRRVARKNNARAPEDRT